ncbi:hypothetical protein HMPREF0793_0959 [Staphylococcus caprae M23864:W1]|nr:hypothetical protein HMPREF0793_0959 [Staphylococcus caprae M23864:W1]OHO68115.1 hypothetical protein HMPREF2580_11090 [Staphylococcus sp. HMSC036D05]PAK63597.1 hypothetical protein B9K00_10655 [Staphylococcus caprae]
MLVITLLTVFLIMYSIIFNKSFSIVVIAPIVQSIILFIIRYFWLQMTFKSALVHSFDLFTIAMVIAYGFYRLGKRKNH